MAIDLTKKLNSVVIKWRNIHSNESGYVKDVNRTDKHFENTFDKAEARVYGNKGSATSVVKTLISYGEGENNIFEIVSV